MKVLAICGSQRRKGNTSRLLREASSAAEKSGAVTEVLFLSDYDIQQCDGCLVCEETHCRGNCSIEDDMTKIVVPKLLAADAIIIGTPSYFDLPTGLLKAFMDRSNTVLEILAEKTLYYGIVVVGQSDMKSLDAVTNAVARYCSICGMRPVRGCVLKVIARDVGDVDKNALALQKARNLGARLVQKTVKGR